MTVVSYRPLMWCIIIFSLNGPLVAAWGAPRPLSKQEFSQEFRHFKKIKKLNSRFRQVRSVKEWQTEVVTGGQFQIHRSPKKSLLWEITSPSYMAVKMNPQGFFYKTEKRAPQWQPMKNPKMSDQLKSLFSWLAFDVEALDKDFKVSKIDASRFLLKPKNKNMTFREIIISLGRDNLVSRIEMLESNQDSIVISFSKTQLTE